MKRDRRKAYRKGLWLEMLAALYFILRGYQVLHLRYKAPVGEIDIVVRKRDVLVFVEVKGRKEISDALESVGFRNRMRVEQAARHFLSRHPEFSGCAMRFDIVAFAPFLRFRHLDNAWAARS